MEISQRRSLKHEVCATPPFNASGELTNDSTPEGNDKPTARALLTPVDAGSTNRDAEEKPCGEDLHVNDSTYWPASLPDSFESQPPQDTSSSMLNAQVKVPIGNDLLACDKVARMNAHANSLEDRIRSLEILTLEFSRRVKDVTKDFRGLRDEIEHVSEELEVLEADHFTVLSCLEEERQTRASYIQKLRNAEVELFHIYQEYPEAAEATMAISQAKSFDAIFERFK